MNNVKRKARIKDIIENKAIVEIQSFSACGNCILSSNCNNGKCKGYTIEVPLKTTEEYTKGEEVYIEISAKEAFAAVFMSYVLPLILVILTLSISMIITNNEIKSGIYSIFILIPYYLLLLLITNKNKIPMKFKLEKISAKENG